MSEKCRARILKLLRSPRIDSKESIPPAFAAWRAGTTTRFLAPNRLLKNSSTGHEGRQIDANANASRPRKLLKLSGWGSE
jgi:hypothetical protein